MPRVPRLVGFFLTLGFLVLAPLGILAWGSARAPRAPVVLVTPGVSIGTAHERLVENGYQAMGTPDPMQSRAYAMIARHNAAYFLELDGDRVTEVGGVFAVEEARRVRRALREAFGDPVTEADGVIVFDAGAYVVSAAEEEGMEAFIFTVHPAP